MFLQNVKCLRHGTLRYVRVENRHDTFKRHLKTLLFETAGRGTL